MSSRQHPLVSVIVPTYKRAGLVPRAIDSILRQTVQDIEVIVVDDCSPDNTRDVVMAIKDGRIRYLRHERNKGLPAGRNTGIAAARGTYIAFLDDDDEWRPKKLEKQLAVAAHYEAVLCGALVNSERLKLHRRAVVTVDDLRRGNEFDPSSLLANAALLRELRFDEDLRQGEDWDAFIRIAQKTPIGYLAEPLLLYNDGMHERMTNQARNLSIDDLERRMPVLEKHRAFFGPFWYRFHVADTYLAYIATRSNRWEALSRAYQRCGVVPLLMVILRKVTSKFHSVTARLGGTTSRQQLDS